MHAGQATESGVLGIGLGIDIDEEGRDVNLCCEAAEEGSEDRGPLHNAQTREAAELSPSEFRYAQTSHSQLPKPVFSTSSPFVTFQIQVKRKFWR